MKMNGKRMQKLKYLRKTTAVLAASVTLCLACMPGAVMAEGTEVTGEEYTQETAPESTAEAALTSEDATPVAMHRLFYPGNAEHLYTADTNERNVLITRGWKYEGVGWYAPASSSIPVYRMFNKSAGDHLYTMDYNEYTVLQSRGWTAEGICWYSDEMQTVPIYRQNHKTAVTGAHNYTTDPNERRTLVAGGSWRDEGTAWYGLKGFDPNYFAEHPDSFGYKNGWLKYGGRWYHYDASGNLDANQTEAPVLTEIPGYYVSPMKTGTLNSSEDRIEAMISRAYDYLGTRFVVCSSTAPGGSVDCSGLVMQCLYAAGFDPYPATPAHHALRENEYDSRTLYYQVNMQHVPLSQIRRGDLVWYAKGGTIIHIAIYLGNGKVIDAWPPKTEIHNLHWSRFGSIYAVGRPFP